MGRVEGMGISIQGKKGKRKEIKEKRSLSRAVLVGSYRNHHQSRVE